MRVNVAIETTREFFQHFWIVRLLMTLGALGNPAMLLMAIGTGDTGVFTRRAGPGLVHGCVAGTTGVFRAGAVGDLQGLMNRMAGKTCLDRLIRNMGLMALHAGRNVAVLGMMTFGTGNHGMLARFSRQLSCRPGMAVAALTSQHVIHGDVERGMGIAVACQAVREIRSMRLDMALAALGHDFIPVVFCRAI